MKKRIFSLLLALCLLMALMPVYASAQAEETETDEAQLFANGVSVEASTDTSHD